MRRKFTFFFFLLVSISSWAQQVTQYSMYQLNPFAFNPAFAGLDESLSFTGVYRNQWIGLEGSPESQNISIHMPFYILGGGIGINANNDVIGAHRLTRATLSYSKYLKVGETGQLSIGLSGGIAQQAFDGNKLRTPEGEYDETVGAVLHNDNFLSENNINAISPTFGVGVYYKNESLQVGLSSDNVAEQAFRYNLENENVNIKNKRHYYMYASYLLAIGESFALEPSILGKSDLVEHQLDLSLRIIYNDIFFVGSSFRGFSPNTTDAIVLMAGMQINANVRFAYAYDLSLSPLKTVNTGSHEIVLKYNLNQKIGGGIPPPVIYNPRFL